MSDVENLFYRLQKETGGSLKWEQLDANAQRHFIQAVNIILQITRL